MHPAQIRADVEQVRGDGVFEGVEVLFVRRDFRLPPVLLNEPVERLAADRVAAIA